MDISKKKHYIRCMYIYMLMYKKIFLFIFFCLIARVELVNG